MPIPPKGWGAVEALIHDYRTTLEALGHEVNIVNTPIPEQIVGLVNALDSDVVHIQLDDYVYLAPHINCENVIATSHYAYLVQPDKWDKGYHDNFWAYVNSKAKIFCLSDGIKDVYSKGGISDKRLTVVPNGVRDDLFKFSPECKFPDCTIYLAKIDFRKRQHLFQTIPGLYFAGNIADERFDAESDFYLGEWTKSYLYDNLTNYANLALLSDGEAHSLVCLEAMSAGLGLVISEFSTANLDTDLPFIDVIPEDKIQDTKYIAKVLKKNRKKSIPLRQEIRKYVVDNFAWESVIKDYYLPEVEKIVTA